MRRGEVGTKIDFPKITFKILLNDTPTWPVPYTKSCFIIENSPFFRNQVQGWKVCEKPFEKTAAAGKGPVGEVFHQLQD